MLRVFSIPGSECVSIVMAGLAFSNPPVQYSREIIIFSVIPPLFKNTSGRFGRDPILGTQVFVRSQVPEIVLLMEQFLNN